MYVAKVNRDEMCFQCIVHANMLDLLTRAKLSEVPAHQVNVKVNTNKNREKPHFVLAKTQEKEQFYLEAQI